MTNDFYENVYDIIMKFSDNKVKVNKQDKAKLLKHVTCNNLEKNTRIQTSGIRGSKKKAPKGLKIVLPKNIDINNHLDKEGEKMVLNEVFKIIDNYINYVKEETKKTKKGKWEMKELKVIYNPNSKNEINILEINIKNGNMESIRMTCTEEVVELYPGIRNGYHYKEYAKIKEGINDAITAPMDMKNVKSNTKISNIQYEIVKGDRVIVDNEMNGIFGIYVKLDKDVDFDNLNNEGKQVLLDGVLKVLDKYM